jgi:hypothetical protein
MTKERFDGIKARSKESLVEMFPFLLDMRDLVAEVERLTRERDAMAEDFTVVMRGLTRLEQGSDYVRLEKEPCKTCAYGPTSKDCYGCGRIDYRCWEWRGVKEAGE